MRKGLRSGAYPRLRFTAPESWGHANVFQADHAARAVRCALGMQDALAELNGERARHGLPALHMGIGLHPGTVVLGDIGTPERREYTAIGNAVNVAARIEQLTKTYDVPILVSEETRLDSPCRRRIHRCRSDPCPRQDGADPDLLRAPSSTMNSWTCQ
jgi:class 3 adenylate cyclase